MPTTRELARNCECAVYTTAIFAICGLIVAFTANPGENDTAAVFVIIFEVLTLIAWIVMSVYMFWFIIQGRDSGLTSKLRFSILGLWGIQLILSLLPFVLGPSVGSKGAFRIVSMINPVFGLIFAISVIIARRKLTQLESGCTTAQHGQPGQLPPLPMAIPVQSNQEQDKQREYSSVSTDRSTGSDNGSGSTSEASGSS
eukprot:TRINITY_DN675_c1_g3_i1.p1 TRINITY_DN675_c1_g3~~TRINITY_DN675_c1_g3_i1.p1  ORF type:complete len:199 (+),score=5.57 TRINITY_DN675_c1_g3_i1:119-715(+)